MTRTCERCDKPIRSATTATVFLDSDGGGAVLAHDACAPDLIDRPGRFRWIALSDIERRGDVASPYRVQPSLASKMAHYREKEWFTQEHRQSLHAAHVLADSLGMDRRKPKGRRPIPTSLRTRILERDGFKCRRCGCGPNVAPLVMDHVIPVASGGRTDYGNLQTLCEHCNSGKGARPPHAHDFVS